MIWKNGVKQNYFEKEQKNWWACGVCCLHYFLRKQGFKFTAHEVLELLEFQSSSSISGNGVAIGDILEVLNLLEIRVKIKRFCKTKNTLIMDYLKNETSKGPVLLFILGHVICVLKVSGSYVHIIEPDDLKRIVSSMTANNFLNYCFNSENPAVLSLV